MRMHNFSWHFLVRMSLLHLSALSVAHRTCGNCGAINKEQIFVNQLERQQWLRQRGRRWACIPHQPFRIWPPCKYARKRVAWPRQSHAKGFAHCKCGMVRIPRLLVAFLWVPSRCSGKVSSIRVDFIMLWHAWNYPYSWSHTRLLPYYSLQRYRDAWLWQGFITLRWRHFESTDFGRQSKFCQQLHVSCVRVQSEVQRTK